MDFGSGKDLAVIFPGQGSQEKNMGRDVAEFWSEAMELWKRAESISGYPLREIFWDGDDQAMAETRYQQPALVVVSLTLWQLLKSNLHPLCFAGHSIGEYTALAASRVLEISELLRLVSLRGRLMYEAGQEQAGKMAAILKLSQEKVQNIVEQVRSETGQELCVANYNTPVQFVVSGEVRAVDQTVKLSKQHKGRAIVLPVSGAFHSSLMQEPAKELADFMEKLNWRKVEVPIYFNVTGNLENRLDTIKENMQKQMVSSVLWLQLINKQWENGIRTWLEVGPKGVLSRMMPQILADKEEKWQTEKINDLEKVNQVST